MSDSSGPNVIRVILIGEAKMAHDRMLKQLRTQYVKLNSSKLVSWIVKRYADTAFEQERQLIIDAHFDNKEYLRNALSAVGSREDLEKALNEALHRVKATGEQSRRARQKRKKGVEPVPPTVTAEKQKDIE